MSRRTGRPAGAAGLGLSWAHKSGKRRQVRRPAVAVVWKGGALLRSQVWMARPRSPGGQRGEVVGFSKASRRRLLYLFHSINQEEVDLPLFVTLTYPGKDWERFAGCRKDTKRHLDNFRRWLSYHYPEAVVLWRFEYQPRRGAPHYHLLIFGVPFIAHEEIAKAWYEIVGSGQDSHLKAGTQVKRCDSWGQAGAYLAKYMSKPDVVIEGDLPIYKKSGRVWGVWQKERLPREPIFYEMDEEQFFRLRRIARGVCKARNYRLKASPAFTTFLRSKAAERALRFVGAEALNSPTGESEPRDGHDSVASDE